MLTNVTRLLGAVKRQKEARSIYSRPAQVILPLSGNHGDFGGDGLYAESKASLEVLFNKWCSEGWNSYLSLCGAIIGWTRGTSLMNLNDIVAEDIEKLGARTFSRKEMAYMIVALLTDHVRSQCEDQPLLADLNGGLGEIEDLSYMLRGVRANINEESEIKKAVLSHAQHDAEVTGVNQQVPVIKIQPRSSLRLPFPTLPDYSTEIAPISSQLQGMVDLDRTVVITGFAEVNPFGNARTRWDMEMHGEFSVSGCIELAAMLGLIKSFNGPISSNTSYSGWVDAKTNEPVTESTIKTRYEKIITESVGIRLVKAADGEFPKWETLQEVVIQDNLAPFEMRKSVAESLKSRHGDKVSIIPSADEEIFTVRFRKGATILVPKSAKSVQVAGRIPDHWNAAYFGVPAEIIEQVDPGTLFVLVCAAETLVASGIPDPYELYRYIHVSDFGNCIGSGLGGTEALQKVFKDRYLQREVQNDILQETFVNTAAAWVNLLLLSASGPNRTPVGACATSLESLETGFENIVSGKARACLVGGYDNIHESTAREFGNMGATVNVRDDLARGRDPREMSRPTTSTRSGFVESEGCGMQLVTSASLALEMGLPIHGIVALVEGASDKIGRSIPAPGQGIMTNVRETTWTREPPILDLKLRRRLRDMRMHQIDESARAGQQYITEAYTSHSPVEIEELTQEVSRDAERQKRDVLFALGNNFWKDDTRISPMRGALATWGLTADDLGVASMHGTSTKKNDENETRVLHAQLQKLGRTPGNPILAVCQKYLTGHPKGAAGAWMLNGCLQIMDSGFVPGNANADDIDVSLKQYEHVAFLHRGIQTRGIKACSVTSFGFGQKGYQAVLVHPTQLFATLTEDAYLMYCEKAATRARKAVAHFQKAVTTGAIFEAKSDAPYTPQQEQHFLFDPLARLV
jgi:fatty acid synthase subunit alpha